MLTILKSLLLLLMTVVLVLFAVVNRHDLTISLFPLPYEIQLPVYLFVLIFFITGFAVAWLAASLRRAGQAMSRARDKRRIEALENELRGLRLGRSSSSTGIQNV